MVVNALTSPGMVAASLACLQPGGRFVEIGKRGIWSQAAVAASRPDVRCRPMISRMRARQGADRTL